MPTINTTGWSISTMADTRLLSLPGFQVPVYVKHFVDPHAGYCVVYPKERLSGGDWGSWLDLCKRLASYDVHNRYWVWTNLALSRMTLPIGTPVKAPPTEEERRVIRAAREEAEKKFAFDLLELSKNENIPEELWNNYSYPSHLKPCDPQPTALQRITVQKYWQKADAVIAASVGTGKSRMVVDILTARALSGQTSLQNSTRIVLLVAPLALHTNWVREFDKWKSGDAVWHCHRFAPTNKFWEAASASAETLFGTPGKEVAGGLVIICTPNSLSRTTLMKHFASRGCQPTAIIVDEVQRFFRNPDNNAFRNLLTLRQKAHVFIGLTGTPTSKFQDWWGLEELAGASDASHHWKGGTFTDYVHLGSPDTMAQSGLFESGWSFDRAIKAYHADRINKSNIFVADKFFYMRDALPGIGQEEIGSFADTRQSFFDVFNDHPAWVEAAVELQKQCNPNELKGGEHVIAQVLLLRMRQLAAMSAENEQLLAEFVTEFLDKDEPCVFWVEFRNEPCPQLDKVVKYLSTIAPTSWVGGGMAEKDRQDAIDGFQSGHYRFIVCQIDAGGVGLTLTRACKSLFLSIPYGYLAIAQAIGRLHRLGQTKDVLSYFAMTSPVAAFARGIYDRRMELNEVIPQKITGVLPKQIVDKLPRAAETS